MNQKACKKCNVRTHGKRVVTLHYSAVVSYRCILIFRISHKDQQLFHCEESLQRSSVFSASPAMVADAALNCSCLWRHSLVPFTTNCTARRLLSRCPHNRKGAGCDGPLATSWLDRIRRYLLKPPWGGMLISLCISPSCDKTVECTHMHAHALRHPRAHTRKHMHARTRTCYTYPC